MCRLPWGLSVWLSMENCVCGLNGNLYGWICMEVYRCGFQWQLICVDLTG